jgi:hypothetical protein
LKEAIDYAEPAFNVLPKTAQKAFLEGLKAYWNREFVPNPGEYRVNKWEIFKMRELEFLTVERLIAMAGAKFKDERWVDSPMCLAISELFELKSATLDDCLAGVKALISVEDRIAGGCAEFAGSTINSYLKFSDNLDFGDKKLQKLILLPTQWGMKEGYKDALLEGLEGEKKKTVENMLATKKEEEK